MAEGATVGNATKVAADLTALALQYGIAIPDLVGTYSEAVDAVLAIAAQRTDQPFNASQSIQSAFPGSTVQQQAPAPQAPQQPAQGGFGQSPNVVAAPGAQVVPFPGAGNQADNGPFGGAPQVPGANQGGGGDESAQLEQAWRQFFTDLANNQAANNWHDNRNNKKSAKSPDFRHKTWKFNDSDRFNVSLWVGSDKNPAWVAGELQKAGLA